MTIIFKKSGRDFNIMEMIDILVERLEYKSHHLEKKYPPLKMIFLINNVFYIHSKISHKNFTEKHYVDQDYCQELNLKIKKYIEEYLKLSWGAVIEDTFNDKESAILIKECESQTLKNTTRETIKRKFAVIRNVLNLAFQQHNEEQPKHAETY